MNKWLTKNTVLLIGLAGTIALLFLGVSQNSKLCSYGSWCEKNWDFVSSVGNFLHIFPIILLFAFILWNMSNKIFVIWRNFIYWWLPLYAFIVFASPSSSHGWALSGPNQETSAFIMNGLFFLISLILIAYKSYRLRGK